MHFKDNVFADVSPATLSSNIFKNITGRGSGIGIYLENSPNMLIQSNQFSNIRFPSFSGVEEAAGIYIDEASTNVLLHSNSFSQCSASIGGAISFKNSFVNFINNEYL